MSITKSVSTEVVLNLTDTTGSSATPVVATLSYQVANPYAVEVSFHVAHDQTVEWIFARDLLGAGVHAPSGDGDVKVWPSPTNPGHIQILLSSPSGNARFLAPTAPIEEFLRRSYALVPAGLEGAHLDLDVKIGELIRRSEWRGV